MISSLTTDSHWSGDVNSQIGNCAMTTRHHRMWMNALPGYVVSHNAIPPRTAIFASFRIIHLPNVIRYELLSFSIFFFDSLLLSWLHSPASRPHLTAPLLIPNVSKNVQSHLYQTCHTLYKPKLHSFPFCECYFIDSTSSLCCIYPPWLPKFNYHASVPT